MHWCWRRSMSSGCCALLNAWCRRQCSGRELLFWDLLMSQIKLWKHGPRNAFYTLYIDRVIDRAAHGPALSNEINYFRNGRSIAIFIRFLLTLCNQMYFAHIDLYTYSFIHACMHAYYIRIWVFKNIYIKKFLFGVSLTALTSSTMTIIAARKKSFASCALSLSLSLSLYIHIYNCCVQ